jgi:1,4-dihydroxy-2-naphthoyl-CoA synthase
MDWITVKEYEDITYKMQWVARIAFNRPDVRNAFRPKTTSELYSMMRKKTLLLGLFCCLLKVLRLKMECILL